MDMLAIFAGLLLHHLVLLSNLHMTPLSVLNSVGTSDNSLFIKGFKFFASTNTGTSVPEYFLPLHGSLRTTPAQAAGVSPYIWELEDVAKLVDSN